VGMNQSKRQGRSGLFRYRQSRIDHVKYAETAEESIDPLPSEDMVFVVDPSDLSHFEVVPPVPVSHGRRDSFRSS
jgi:hypothetical protein